MPEYGVTKDGFVRKRLDVIISEIQIVRIYITLNIA